jgi:hypothetical protein
MSPNGQPLVDRVLCDLIHERINTSGFEMEEDEGHFATICDSARPHMFYRTLVFF